MIGRVGADAKAKGLQRYAIPDSSDPDTLAQRFRGLGLRVWKVKGQEPGGCRS